MTTGASGKPLQILLVEDIFGDARLTWEALKECNVSHHLHLVTDGEEALAFLRRQGKYADAVRPDIILLDLNLPKKDGREVLAEIKADEELKRIPVLVLTVSAVEEDIFESYGQYANCYITKPPDLEQFIQVMKSIESFWFTTVKLPQQARVPVGEKLSVES